MTLIDLHNMLGEELKKVRDSETLPKETQKKVLDSAIAFSSLSKQMINNADVILRSQKLLYDKRIPSNSAIAQLVSNRNE